MAFRNSVKATLFLEGEQPRSRFDEPAPLFEVPAPPAPIAPQTAADDAPSAASLHARAAALRAIADTVPSQATRPLMPKIAAIYDEVAGETAPPEPEPPLPEEPSVIAPPAEPWPTQRAAFPRRPLPQGRPVARRRG